MGSCAAPSAKGDDKFITTDYLQQCQVGIPDDLIQDIAIRELAFGAGTLHAAVASYVQSPRYYRALMAGGARYDLKGQPCGEVTPQEQKEAETRLMVLNDRQKARKPR
ncbi:ProQ/FinO family protein [Escherichia coli]